MIPETDDTRGVNRIRLLIAVGLVINYAGFFYDWTWHAQNLSITPITPGKLLTVHGLIYLGALIVTVATIDALVRRPFTAAVQKYAVWLIALGLLVEFTGDATDMWAHGHGYEKDLYHDLVTIGAALTVVGYLVIELFHLISRSGPDPVEEPAESEPAPAPADPAGRR